MFVLNTSKSSSGLSGVRTIGSADGNGNSYFNKNIFNFAVMNRVNKTHSENIVGTGERYLFYNGQYINGYINKGFASPTNYNHMLDLENRVQSYSSERIIIGQGYTNIDKEYQISSQLIYLESFKDGDSVGGFGLDFGNYNGCIQNLTIVLKKLSLNGTVTEISRETTYFTQTSASTDQRLTIAFKVPYTKMGNGDSLLVEYILTGKQFGNQSGQALGFKYDNGGQLLLPIHKS